MRSVSEIYNDMCVRFSHNAPNFIYLPFEVTIKHRLIINHSNLKPYHEISLNVFNIQPLTLVGTFFDDPEQFLTYFKEYVIKTFKIKNELKGVRLTWYMPENSASSFDIDKVDKNLYIEF